MPCLPPLWQPFRQYLCRLFRRASGARGSHASSSGTELSGLDLHPPIETKLDVAGVDAKRLVCHFCWDVGLFAPGPFQEVWAAQTTYTGFSYTTTWSQLHDSSISGCQWCALVLSTRNEGMFQETIHVTVGFRVNSGGSAITPNGVHILRLVINDAPHSAYYVYTEPDDPAATFLVARTRVLQVNSPSTRTMASDCVTNCIRNHDRCPAPHSAVLPTRVIDCSYPAKPKLHLGNGEKAPYVALSYVRGENQPHGTTTANLDSTLIGIDLRVLPQTIKDAIEATHAYGIRYLWVDSLCILQDSEEDEAREIAQLQAVFRNAYFTIVAASAKKVSDGFLQDRAPPSPPDMHLPFHCPDGQVGTMRLSPVWRQYDGSAEPVNQRAWCLEERLLSPRALLYASHTLQFQCQTSVVNVGNAVCGPMVRQRLPDLLFRRDAELATQLSLNDKKILRWSWIEAVGEYTHRSLTNPGDKLVAFAAIAEAFQRLWNSEYLAGLWRDNLVEYLLWYKTFETRYGRPEPYRAPSWSWAAVEGRVMASSVDDRLDPSSNETETCEILGCDVTVTVPLLSFGKVGAGTLTLRAAMLKAAWTPNSPTPDLYLEHSDGPSGASEDHPSAVAPSEPIHIGSAYPDSMEDAQDVWAIPVHWNHSVQYAAGLIVARSAEHGMFRRVGYFHSPEGAVEGLSWMLDKEQQVVVLV